MQNIHKIPPRPTQWTVPPEWEGQTAYIVAGGPSVLSQNVELLRDKNVIAVNSSYLTVPWAQFLFFGDARWFIWHAKRQEFKDFQGRIVTCSDVVRGHRLLGLFRVLPPPGAPMTVGLDLRPTHVASQRTNLQGAMNMAFHLGVKRMVLLGVDMGPLNGITHHHEKHPWPNPANCWDEQIEQLKLIVEPLDKLGIEVINTSNVSRIPWWQKMTLEQAIEGERYGKRSVEIPGEQAVSLFRRQCNADSASGIVPGSV